MQRILLTLGQAMRRSIFIVGLMTLISLSGLFIFVQQPSYADTSSSGRLTPEEKIDRAYEYSEATGLLEEDRQKAYEQALEDAESTDTIEKAYERNLKAEKGSQPNLIQKAEELVEKVTGQ